MDTKTSNEIAAAVADADRLLIVAAAGLSISTHLPNNPYHNPHDFALHYPRLGAYGYRTSYECMGIGRDPNVPDSIKKALTARHFLNMRWNFPPTAAYTWLHELSETFMPGDVFAWTSNVDGCFVRSGFDKDHVYTTQGQMDKMQCGACSSVFENEQQLRAIDAASPDGELTDMSLAMRCPSCGSQDNILPNLRGGDWFIHAPYQPTQERLLAWLDEAISKKLRVAVLEIGVGPNTPVVTRTPAAAFATALGTAGGAVTFVRVNPDRAEEDYGPRGDIPQASGVAYYRWRAGWDALKPMLDAATVARAARRAGEQDKEGQRVEHVVTITGVGAPGSAAEGGEDAERVVEARQWQERYHRMMQSLRTPRCR